MNIKEIIFRVKQKKEFKNFDEDFLLRFLQSLFSKQLSNPKIKETEIAKIARAKLREIYGAFLTNDFFKLEKRLDELQGITDIDGHKRILKSHLSTRERLPFYKEVYEKIFGITGKPKSILDLGCGLNPFSLPFMGIMPEYFAGELTESDVKLIQKYFDKIGVKGKAFQVDLTNLSEDLPRTDVCFLFKVLDTAESVRRDVTSEIFARINSRWIVASFSTKSLGGKKNIRKRKWFEKLIAGKEYCSFEIPNEIFYVIEAKH